MGHLVNTTLAKGETTMGKTSVPKTPALSPPVEKVTTANTELASERLGEMLGRAESEEREKRENERLAEHGRISKAD